MLLLFDDYIYFFLILKTTMKIVTASFYYQKIINQMKHSNAFIASLLRVLKANTTSYIRISLEQTTFHQIATINNNFLVIINRLTACFCLTNQRQEAICS